MPTIVYRGNTYRARDGETLLGMFQRLGVKVPFSCGGGVCHICLHRSVSGPLPAAAQKGLRDIYREKNYLLLCKCVPEGDMEIALPGRAERYTRMSLAEAPVPQGVAFSLVLEPHTRFRAGKGRLVQVHADAGFVFEARVDEEVAPGEIVRLTTTGVAPAVLGAATVGADFEVSGPMVENAAALDETETDAADTAAAPGGAAVPAERERPYPEPDLALWRALDDGALITKILNIFYPRIFADELLGPYFREATVRRLVEKQYNFLRQAITGEKVFFGERPRNSHHWMVISDEIFDRRSRYLVETMEELGVPAAVIEQLIGIEDRYREDIVKDQPRNKVLFGQELPVEGYEPLVLDEGTLCDACAQEVPAGETVIYHVRTGKLYCSACRQDRAH